MNTQSSIQLIAGLNDPNPHQEKFRQKLQPEVQRYWDSLFSKHPNSSRAVLHAYLATWLVGRGRKVRIGNKEVTNVEELNELLGYDKTLSTLLQALGSAA